MAYVGILVSGFDPGTGRYIDPMVAAQSRLDRAEANTKMAEAARKEAVALDRRVIEMLRAALTGPVPAAHLELMNAYRDRIIEANR